MPARRRSTPRWPTAASPETLPRHRHEPAARARRQPQARGPARDLRALCDNPPPGTSGQTSTLMPMTTLSPTRLLHPTPLRVATVTLCLTLGGCTVIGDW